ncbi:MAG: hypothetical protein AAF617_13765, partial [Bacteroidota bacterium]
MSFTFSFGILIVSYKNVGWGRMVMTSEPSLVRDVLTNRSGLYSVAKANAILEPVVGKYSVFVREGKDHGLARGQIKKPLGASALSEYRPWLVDLSQEYLRRIEDTPSALREEVRRFCMATMTRLCFGKSNGRLVDQAIKKIGPVLGVVPSTLAFVPALHQDLGPLSPVRYLNFRLSRFDALLVGEINEALRDNKRCLATHLGEVCNA